MEIKLSPSTPAPVTARETTQFPKGVSGNPNGRPKGAVSKTTEFRLAIQTAMEEEMYSKAVELMRVLIQDAIDGDATARKIIMDRLMPAKKAVDSQSDNQKGNIIINVTTKSNDTTTISGEVIDVESD